MKLWRNDEQQKALSLKLINTSRVETCGSINSVRVIVDNHKSYIITTMRNLTLSALISTKVTLLTKVNNKGVSGVAYVSTNSRLVNRTDSPSSLTV